MLYHLAAAAGNSWTVVLFSGTDELKRITGSGQIERHEYASHTFALDSESPAE